MFDNPDLLKPARDPPQPALHDAKLRVACRHGAPIGTSVERHFWSFPMSDPAALTGHDVGGNRQFAARAGLFFTTFRKSIRHKIISVSFGMAILMVIVSVLSIVMTSKVANLLDELGNKYIIAYGDLSRANIRSLERAVAFRQMIIAKMQDPPDEETYASKLKIFNEKNIEVEKEANDARRLIISIIEDDSTPSDNAALARIESRIDAAMVDRKNHLNEVDGEILAQLQNRDFASARHSLAEADKFRQEFSQKIDAARSDMLKQVHYSSSTVENYQIRTILVSCIVTFLAIIIGMFFAMLISSGIVRPVRQLLEGTRDVEAGRLDKSIDITTIDEIGQLSAAFNRMIEQLRHKEKIQETFGKYIDPKIVEGLINRPALALSEGQRRVMTVLFCDMKGFTSISEGMTPQGLVKVMNRYLSIMSEPIRAQQGIIDKYIGDAVMAYWGPPFVDPGDQARLASLAAIDMVNSIETLRRDIPELLGVRSLPLEFDIRIGVATGDALVGSIGSEFMMSYTVMGDVVNLASRLEGVNKVYGSRLLATETTVAAAEDDIEAREIDRLVVVGQTQPTAVFEIMGRKGELTPAQLLLRSKYSEGLGAYRGRRWGDARAAFTAALHAIPGDGPSTALLKRVETFDANPPPADWDGSWHLDQK